VEKASKDTCDGFIKDVRNYTEDGALFPIYLTELYHPAKKDAVDAVNRALKESADAHEHVYVVPIASLLSRQHASPDDQLHLAPAGYKKVLEAIALTVGAIDQRPTPARATAAAAATAVATPTTLLRTSSEKLTSIDKAVAEKWTARGNLNAPSVEEMSAREERVRKAQEELNAAKDSVSDGKRNRTQQEKLDKEINELNAKRRRLNDAKEQAEKAVEAEHQLAEATQAAAAAAAAAEADVD
jgi:hypothetical protein